MKFSDFSKKKTATPEKQEQRPAPAPVPEPIPAPKTEQEKPAAKQFLEEQKPQQPETLPPIRESKPPEEKPRVTEGPTCVKPCLPIPKEKPSDSLWSKISGIGEAFKQPEVQGFEMPKMVSPDDVPAMNDTSAYAQYIKEQEEQAYNLYEYCVLSVRYALLSLICEDRTAYGPIASAADNITTMLDSGNQSLVALAGRRYMPDNNSRHSVNVAIYSVFLCELLNMKKEERIFVACAALLHDLGMQKYERILNKPDKFTQAEREMIQRHPMDAKGIIENLEGLNKNTAQALAKVVMEVYEKYDGSGYPFKKQGESISQQAQVISIANVYEALTHARSWRKELHQHDALKMMLDNAGSAFSKKTVRLLIDGLSMYPPGSLVQLSTGDTARVIEVNPKLISQPKVELLKNSRTSANRFLNLATEKGILITNVAKNSDKSDL